MRERVDSILVSEMCISEMCISEARVSEERDCKIHIAASRQTRQDLITSSSAFMPVPSDLTPTILLVSPADLEIVHRHLFYCHLRYRAARI